MTRRRMVLGLVALALLLALVLPFFLRRTLPVYTDGARFRADAAQAKKVLREVLWQEAVPLAAGVNLAETDEYEPRVSPDGRFLAFTRGRPGGHADLWIATRLGSSWSQARPLEEINSPDDEMGAYFAILSRASVDGQSREEGPKETLALLFYSNRPGGEGGYDLWISFEDAEGRWKAPLNLGPGVNTPFNEFSPSLDRDGKTLYFTTNRRGGQSPPPPHWLATLRETLQVPDYDVYRADVEDLSSLKIGSPRGVEELNLAGYSEGAIAFSPQGDFLYFTSNRPGGLGGFDLYRARVIDGKLGQPENLGPQVNTRGHELDPALSSSGFELYFSRRGDRAPTEDIFVSVSKEVFLEREPGDAYWSFAGIRAFLFALLGRINPIVLAVLASLLVCAIFVLVFGRRMSRLALITRCFVMALLVHLLLAIWMNSSKVQRVLLENLGTSDHPGAFEVSLENGAEEEVAISIRNQVAETGQDAAPAFDLGSDPVAKGAPLAEIRAPSIARVMELEATPLSLVAARKTLTLLPKEPGAPEKPSLPAGERDDPFPAQDVQTLSLEAASTDPLLRLVPRGLSTPPRPQLLLAPVEFTDRQDPEAHPIEEIRPLPLDLKASAQAKPEQVRLDKAPRTHPEKESFAIDRQLQLEPEHFLDGPTDVSPVVDLALAPEPGSPEPGPSFAAPRLEPWASRAETKEVGGGSVAKEKGVLAPMAPGAAREPRATPGAPMLTFDRPEPGQLSEEPAKGGHVSLGPASEPQLPNIVRSQEPPLLGEEPQRGREPAGTVLEVKALPSGKKAGVNPKAVGVIDLVASDASERERFPLGQGVAPASAPETSPPEDALEASPPPPLIAREESAGLPEPSDGGMKPSLLSSAPSAEKPPTDAVRPGHFSSDERPELSSEQRGLESAPRFLKGHAPSLVAVPSRRHPGEGSKEMAAKEGAAGPGPEPKAFPPEGVRARGVLPGRSEETSERVIASRVGESRGPVDGPTETAKTSASGLIGEAPFPRVSLLSTEARTPPPVSFLGQSKAQGGALPRVGPPGESSPERPSPAGPSGDAERLGFLAAAFPPSRNNEPPPPAPLRPRGGGTEGEKELPRPSRLQAHGRQGGEPAPGLSVLPREPASLPAPANRSASPAAPQEHIVLSDATRPPRGEEPPASRLAPPPRTLVSSSASTDAQPLFPSKGPFRGEAEPMVAAERKLPGASRWGSGGTAAEIVLARRRRREPLPAPPLKARPLLIPASAAVFAERMSLGHLASGPEPSLKEPDRQAALEPASSGFAPLRSVPATSSFVPKIYQLREKSRRPEAVRLGGGSPETERAVALGLKWLALHQSPNGRWSLHDYARHLPRASERDVWHPDWDGTGQNDSRGGTSRAQNGDTAGTGLAILAFLGHGDTQAAEGPYRENVQKGLRYLVSRQQRDGDLRDGGNLYMHAIATFALCEAYALTKEPQLEEPSRRAVGFTVRSQNPDLGGWRYEPYPQGRDVDTSVFGWMLMGLKSARLGGIDIDPKCVDRMVRYLESARMTTTGGRFAYQPGLPRTSLAMTAQGLFCQQALVDFLAPVDERTQGRLRKAAGESVSYMLRNLPEAKDQDGTNSYYWYYATLAMFQEGGAAWEAWNKRMKEIVLGLQLGEDEGTAAGSWDPIDRRAELGGRVYSTALGILCLEVYYRYAPKGR